MTLMNTDGRATSASDTRIVTVTGHVRRILATATVVRNSLDYTLGRLTGTFSGLTEEPPALRESEHETSDLEALEEELERLNTLLQQMEELASLVERL